MHIICSYLYVFFFIHFFFIDGCNDYLTLSLEKKKKKKKKLMKKNQKNQKK